MIGMMMTVGLRFTIWDRTGPLPRHTYVMSQRYLASFLLIAAAVVSLLAQSATSPSPSYTTDNRLTFPADYREWVFLSSGLGMTYGPAANPNGTPLFDNVFVSPASYREFMKTGRWPDKSVFVLEVRRAVTEGSINKGGNFQKDLAGIEVEVKDTDQFPETNGWGFYDFGSSREPAKQLPKNQACYTCHATNGAVEQTFVQFYPTLIDVAKAHGTFKSEAAK